MNASSYRLQQIWIPSLFGCFENIIFLEFLKVNHIYFIIFILTSQCVEFFLEGYIANDTK